MKADNLIEYHSLCGNVRRNVRGVKSQPNQTSPNVTHAKASPHLSQLYIGRVAAFYTGLKPRFS